MGWNRWVAQATKTRGLGTLAATLAIAVGALSAVAPAQAQTATGIAATKHNLTNPPAGVGTAVTNKFTGTGVDNNMTEICVFCHTPHGADTTAAVPLWNRKLNSPSSYTLYDELKTSSLDGKSVQVGSVSLACLSCHDGQTALNTVLNAPGSGRYSATGTTMTGTWVGDTVDSTTGKLLAGAISNIGTDLKNDHPIGMPYGGGGYSQTNKTVAKGGTTDPDFNQLDTKDINGLPVWWVETGTAGSGRQKTDIILYTRAAAGGTASATDAQPFVECASCHDPHSQNTTFLRIANTQSAVCLACHIK